MEFDIVIRKATTDEPEILADIIKASYATVADTFNLSPSNCPKHPSNCTIDWVTRDIDRGIGYYLLLENGHPVGCAALERSGDQTVYLERLAVLPEWRHRGYGKALVTHVVKTAKSCKAKTIGIGIIDGQTVLKKWYQELGFKVTGSKKFDHLPFTVGFMEMNI